MDYRPAASIEKEIISILKDELSFYQSMFILADKQKDSLRADHDGELAQIFADIARFNRRVAESERRLKELLEKDRQNFALAASNLEVRRLITSITAILEKNLSLMKENEQFAVSRQEVIRSEVNELSRSSEMMELLSNLKPAAGAARPKK